ncbi:MAG: RsmD family RNA methyltransferase [Victivallaceae bacterium]|nr:RsmD family RNA methyltransferase [Victivallaceae bacterium]
MRIVSGTAANLELEAPDGLSARPTLVRARKALFDHLGSFDGKRVLDLFSGSGMLAMESASRGAAFARMVENAKMSCDVISRNSVRISKTGAACEFDLRRVDAMRPESYLSKGERFDIVFADPPYAESAADFSKLMKMESFVSNLSGARLVWEIPDTPGALGLFMESCGEKTPLARRFGGTLFLIMEL